MSKVRIADMLLDIDCADTAFFDKRLQEYCVGGEEPPEMHITSRLVETVAVPTGIAEEAITDNIRVVTLADGTHCRYTVSKEKKRILQAITYDDAYTTVDIQLLASRRNRVFSLTDFEYVYTGSAFSNRLTIHGGVVLHGSAIRYNNVGIVFTANSGTGKSTHTGLWCDRFGEAVTVVNDDKPAIRFSDGKPILYGTPWSGKTDINRNISTPLKAIVVLEQAPVNALRPLSPEETIFHLTSQIERPYYDRDCGIRTLDAIDTLVRTVPTYLLQCTISQEAVSLVYDTIFGKEDTLK